jgi:hypothetical protein
MLIHKIQSKQDLQLYIKEYIEMKGPKPFTIAIRNSKKLQEFILMYCDNYVDADKLTFSAKAYTILYGRPFCAVCGKHTNFDRNNWCFLDTCSLKCQAINPATISKRKITCNEIYGHDNPASSDIVKKTISETFMKNYGTDQYLKTDDFKIKSKETNMQKYGVTSYAQTPECKQKVTETFFHNFGVAHYSQTEEFKERFIATSLRNFGETHPMKNINIFEKQQMHSYYMKPYILPSGKTVYIQGYENIALDYLFTVYSENEIIISNKEIHKLTGNIEYFYAGKTHRYNPDFYIPSKNLIIEVKSIRTYSVNKEVCELKKQACINKNLLYEFYIIHNNEIKIN